MSFKKVMPNKKYEIESNNLTVRKPLSPLGARAVYVESGSFASYDSNL